MSKGSAFETVIVVPDVQFPFHSNKAVKVYQKFIHDQKPDRVVFIGDTLDMYAASSFPKTMTLDKQRRLKVHTVEAELEASRLHVQKWRESHPSGDWHWIEGNHEERCRRLVTKDPALEGLANVNQRVAIPNGITYHYPYPDACMWAGRSGGLYLEHGRFTTMNAVKKHAACNGVSTLHGHTHRVSSTFETKDVTQKTFGGYEIGWLGDRNKVPKAKGAANWQWGYALVHVSKTTKAFHVDMGIISSKGRFVCDGKWYQ